MEVSLDSHGIERRPMGTEADRRLLKGERRAPGKGALFWLASSFNPSQLGLIIPEAASATGEQPHRGALAAHDQPIAVVLDFVHPTRASGRRGGQGGTQGSTKSAG
jgi:hypothetical protein